MRLISKGDIDKAQLKLVGERFVPLVRWRWLLGPVVVVLTAVMLIEDHAAWRLWLVGGTFAAGALRAVMERRSPGDPLMVFGSARRHVVRDVSVALTIGLPILASGGFDSPMLPIVIPLCFFIGTIAPPRTLIAFTLVDVALVILLAFVSAGGFVSNLVPAVFGGGSGVPRSPVLLFSKAAGLVVALGYAAALSHLVRQVFRQMIGDAVDARDEVLRDHEAHVRELTTLSGELAHELKNPLANVKGLAVLVGRDVHGKGEERLEVLQHEVIRMEEILQGFLTFSRPLSPLHEEDVDLKRLCESVLALHEGMAHAKNVSVRLTASLPVHASCDARKVKQVLINVMQNALDASPADGEVEVVLLPGSRGGARVEVHDRGPGVSPAMRAHLFEPGSTTKERGSGLGLALARGLARQHGGDLLLEDRDGGGCTAVLTLPARAARSTGEAA